MRATVVVWYGYSATGFNVYMHATVVLLATALAASSIHFSTASNDSTTFNLF
jgi:hypothetical protein